MQIFEKKTQHGEYFLIVHIFHYFQHEWRYLLAGGTVKPRDLPNPAPDWLSERSWGDVLTLAALPKFTDFAEDFSNHLPGFKKLFDSIDPHRSV